MPIPEYFDSVNSGNFLPRIYRYEPKPLSKVYHPLYGSKLRTARHDPKKGLYPMDYNLERVKKLVTDIRNEDDNRQAKVHIDIGEFQTLKQYGKDMFEHALNDAKQNTVCRRRSAPPAFYVEEPQQQRQRVRPQTTGPTRIGSPIYNKRAELLNKIRIQTRCYPDSKQANLKNLQQTIDTYSEKYSLIPEDSSEDACAANMTFVDKTELMRLRSQELAVKSVETTEISPDDTAKSPSEEQHSDDEPAVRLIEFVESAPAVLVVDPSASSAPIISVADPLSLPEVKVSSHYDELEKIKKGAAKIEPVRQSQSDGTFLKTRSRSSSASEGNEAKLSISSQVGELDLDSETESVRSARSSHSTDSHISMKPMIRTWVDDISVSSVGNKSQAGSEVIDAAAGAEGSVLPEPPKKVSIDAQEEADMESLQPPDYICPSSEAKSKEYAAKLWLMKTDFSKAPKCIPLV